MTKEDADAVQQLAGPTRTMSLKTAKVGGAKEQGKKANQQAIEKANLKAHLESLTKKR